jgi:hypothetical protein
MRARNARSLLNAAGCLQSMSRADEAYDNCYAESLFSRYKSELLEGGAFSDVEEARMESFNYIILLCQIKSCRYLKMSFLLT